jgi:D-galactarolactone cycloisomerase
MKPLLIGVDALATEAIGQRLYAAFRDHGQKGLAVQALSGLDGALWDLKGKHFGVAAHRLMGGPLRAGVRAYATGTSAASRGSRTGPVSGVEIDRAAPARFMVN